MRARPPLSKIVVVALATLVLAAGCQLVMSDREKHEPESSPEAGYCGSASLGECCKTDDPCGLAGDGVCNCSNACSWDSQDCPSSPTPTNCSGYYGSDSCCQPDNPCSQQDNGQCNCNGTCDWDVNDCSAPAVCPGYSGTSTDCCTADNACDWALDDMCDCDGTCGWDAVDCALPDVGVPSFLATIWPPASGGGDVWICVNRDPDGNPTPRGEFIEVSNVGTADAAPYHLFVGIGPDGGPGQGCTDFADEDGIPTGASETLDGGASGYCCTIPSVPSGTYYTWIAADGNNELAESNEGNNGVRSASPFTIP